MARLRANAMEHSVLPIEVCECVIESCTDAYPLEWYPTLRACALTCSVWLPRSQATLYKVVIVDGNRPLAALLKTVSIRPGLLTLVRSLLLFVTSHPRDHMHSPWPGTYMPYAQCLRLCPLAVNCTHLRVECYDGDAYHPLHFRNILIPSMSMCTRISHLELLWTNMTTNTLFHIIWVMPQLRSLHIIGEGLVRGHPNRWSPAVLAKQRTSGRTLVPSLTTLAIEPTELSYSPVIVAPGTFGHSVTTLRLSIRAWFYISDSMSDCIRSLSLLRSLTLGIGGWSAPQLPSSEFVETPGGSDFLARVVSCLAFLANGTRPPKGASLDCD
ncbi:hypothetical protein C8Q77DRAFT_614226 [Trametes polyzona]|nr:hypothetical protein C8Q77DRAFT_614226 [Trametes polyzona]